MKDGTAKKTWKQDADGVQNDILTVAMAEFAENGLAGARIDEIAANTKTSKRMIYYYFGDKEGLYIAALEKAYALVRQGEDETDIEGLSEVDAMRELVRSIFDHHRTNTDLIRMVMNENVNRAEYLQKSTFIRDLNLSAMRRLSRVLERGQKSGVFRAEIDPVFLHWHIQSQAFYNVANRPSFSTKFGNEMFTEDGQIEMRERIVDSVLRYIVR